MIVLNPLFDTTADQGKPIWVTSTIPIDCMTKRHHNHLQAWLTLHFGIRGYRLTAGDKMYEIHAPGRVNPGEVSVLANFGSHEEDAESDLLAAEEKKDRLEYRMFLAKLGNRVRRAYLEGVEQEDRCGKF